MIWLIVWAIVGWLLGICVVAAFPWIAARLVGGDRQEALASKYVWLAQTACTRAALVVRDGDIKLVGKSYSEEHKADEDKAAGDARHHRDGFGVLGRLANKVFGFGLTDRDSYVSPLLAEIGAAAKEARDRGKLGPVQTDGGTAIADGIPVPETSRLIDLEAAKHLTTGSAEPEDGQESYKKTKISQEKFHEKMSTGQWLILLAGAIGTMVAAWFVASRSGGAGSVPDTSVSILTLLAVPTSWFSIKIADYDDRRVNELYDTRPRDVILAWAFLIGVPALIVISALFTYGILHAGIVFVVMLGTALGIVGFIALMGPSIPQLFGVPIGRLFWVLAQLTVGRGVLIERDSGAIEHRKLHDAPRGVDTEYAAVLSDGKLLPIEGSPGDLFRFGWAPMGATAEKTDENMDPLSEDIEPSDSSKRVKTTFGDWDALLPRPNKNEWLVTGPRLASSFGKTSSSAAVRQGRDKALTEHGGKQQVSQTVFGGLFVLTIILGGLMGLIAGGAIL
jgi:hypothetical protein